MAENSGINRGRHAYLILAHNQFPQLEQLLTVLDDPGNDIFLHVDRKADYPKEISARLQSCLKYSRLNEIQRVTVTWGGYSMIRADMALFSAAAEGHYDYYHLLSGIDFPLKTQKEIHAFFDNHRGQEFVHFSEEEYQQAFERRIRYFWFFQEQIGRGHSPFTEKLKNQAERLVLLQQRLGIDRLRNNPFGRLRAGSNWVSLTDDFVQYLLSRRKDIRKTFRRTVCGDEELVQTVIWNSDFRSRLYENSMEHPGNLRKIDWKRGNPYIWKDQDFEELMQSGCLFARKIIREEDPRLFQRLAERVSADKN